MSRYTRVPEVERVPSDASEFPRTFARMYRTLASAINLMSGNFNLNIDSSAANYVATPQNDVILIDATGGNRTVTLPAAADMMHKSVYVKKTDAGANTVTISAVSGNIDGAATNVISAARGSIEVISDGSNYWKV